MFTSLAVRVVPVLGGGMWSQKSIFCVRRISFRAEAWENHFTVTATGITWQNDYRVYMRLLMYNAVYREPFGSFGSEPTNVHSLSEWSLSVRCRIDDLIQQSCVCVCVSFLEGVQCVCYFYSVLLLVTVDIIKKQKQKNFDIVRRFQRSAVCASVGVLGLRKRLWM